MFGSREKSRITMLSSGAELMDAIRDRLQRAKAPLKRFRYSGFNGGASLDQTLDRVKPFLAADFEVQILVWDHCSANLPGNDNATLKSVADEIGRLDRFLRAHDAYRPSFGYRDFTELACEQLLLGSRILTVPARQAHHIEQIPATVKMSMQTTVDKLNGSVVARKSPFYMPGRIIQLDDIAFIPLYLHTGRAGTILCAPKGTALFERLDQHFTATWDQATEPVMTALGRHAESEADHWRAAAPAPIKPTPKIFLSYRREDTGWATGRLFDRLIGLYTRDGVFLDHQSIAPGAEFPTAIDERLKTCPLMMIMIGSGWLSPRLQDPNDWVVAEIQRGLDQGKHVIPIQVDGAPMPKVADLPDGIKRLAQIQGGLLLRFEHFKTDADKIVDEACRLVPP